jgi:hypothetical protein
MTAARGYGRHRGVEAHRAVINVGFCDLARFDHVNELLHLFIERLWTPNKENLVLDVEAYIFYAMSLLSCHELGAEENAYQLPAERYGVNSMLSQRGELGEDGCSNALTPFGASYEPYASAEKMNVYHHTRGTSAQVIQETTASFATKEIIPDLLTIFLEYLTSQDLRQLNSEARKRLAIFGDQPNSGFSILIVSQNVEVRSACEILHIKSQKVEILLDETKFCPRDRHYNREHPDNENLLHT